MKMTNETMTARIIAEIASIQLRTARKVRELASIPLRIASKLINTARISLLLEDDHIFYLSPS